MPNKAEREAEKSKERDFDSKAVYDPNTGVTSNYFGGRGRSDGPGHGHINVNEAGEVVGPVRDYNENS